jgi:hypothetical protein
MIDDYPRVSNDSCAGPPFSTRTTLVAAFATVVAVLIGAVAGAVIWVFLASSLGATASVIFSCAAGCGAGAMTHLWTASTLHRLIT